jgi:type VI secretion system protein ImpB
MPSESVNKKLSRVRSPRVHISYDVHIGDAIEMKSLPFVMGVLGDFSGMPASPLPGLKDRKFVEVTPDNFDAVLASMKPRLQFAAPNALAGDGEAGKIAVELEFKELGDFDPDRVAARVPELQQLLELRTKLSELRSSLQGNDKLDELLKQVVEDTEARRRQQPEAGGAASAETAGGTDA